MIESTGAALRAVPDWAVEGDEFVLVRLHDSPLGYSGAWAPGDVLAIQGDAHLHVGVDGTIKDVVPPVVGLGERVRR
jgi:hypothetical protein